QDPQPGLDPALVREQRGRLRRRPQVAEYGRVGRVRAAHDPVLGATAGGLGATAGGLGATAGGLGATAGGTPHSMRSAARTSSRFAPHGTTAVAPLTSIPRSSRQHLVSTRFLPPRRPGPSGTGPRA